MPRTASRFAAVWVVVLSTLLCSVANAQRRPVLPQIDLPHPYYFRELYLPQLTSGPSSVTWSPDSQELIYAMAGSLWRQRVGGGGELNVARQLTLGAGYDYQPDWSPDGRWVVYSTYDGAAVELWVLDVQSGATQALTHSGAVSVEPRFSPDGKRLVFVSTQFNQRFHVFTADFAGGLLSHIERLTGEQRSALPRYYYSAFDHEINPTWSRDGREILYVSNRGHLYGTGGMWRAAAVGAGAAGAAGAREIHYEETNWKARPEFSPDGSRVVFSSYLGRAWHNLWLLPANGGDAFPLTYGDWDQTQPRWSPDGTKIACISNQSGNTAIGVVPVPGGDLQTLPVPQRHYLNPMAQLHLDIRDASGKPASARISVTDAAGRFYAPADAWVQADDGFDRRQRRLEAHYFHVHGAATVDVPAGALQVDVVHGFERRFEQRRVTATANQVTALAVDVDAHKFAVPDAGHWVSADVHVHMNYGGEYRNTPAHLSLQAEAEGLGLVNSLIVNKEQRVPDAPYSGQQLDAASQPDALVVHGQEYHTSYWGHLGLLDIAGGIILPGYVGYPNTAASSLYPMNADVADIAHARGALVGYVHPFDEPPQPLNPSVKQTSELPIDVALGKVDYLEILGFSDHRSTAEVWYRLLNLGFRLPAAGGTDAMANYASLRGPVGMNRVYARVDEAAGDVEAVTPAKWLAALQAGRTFATNGPLLGLQMGAAAGGTEPRGVVSGAGGGAGAGGAAAGGARGDGNIGGELVFAGPQRAVAFRARLESIVPVDHLELVCNGEVVRSFARGNAVAGTAAAARGISQGTFSGTIPVATSGWCVLRTSTDGDAYPVLDTYVYATTSPVYLTVGGRAPRSPVDARYFAAWVDRVTEATMAYPDWNSAAEKSGVLGRLAQAKAAFVALQ